MAPMSRGSSKKPSKMAGAKRKRITTDSTKNHRFESFSTRVSKLKIDPIHRNNRLENGVAEDDRQSYFGTALTEWKELNLSETFTKFAHEATPLCHNLAQVLLYQSELAAVLLKYVELNDPLALEPILDLVSHLAHDLEAQFEKHFYPVVVAVSKLAATSKSVEIIEWSFTCLAWLFKYLSHLLVPRLCSTFEIMAPLLGIERQKAFVLRFCAESMSFLVRKAGTSKNKAPLTEFVSSAFGACSRCPEAQLDQYTDGLVYLLGDAIRGTNHGVHSSGFSIIESLLIYWGNVDAREESETTETAYIIRRVLVNIIHHSSKEGFLPIEAAITDFIHMNNRSGNKDLLGVSASALFTVMGARNGSRLTDWAAVLDCIADMVHTIASLSTATNNEAQHSVLAVTALGLGYSPLQLALDRGTAILEQLARKFQLSLYLDFCLIFAEIAPDRFRSLCFPQMIQQVKTQWDYEHVRIGFFLRRFNSVFPDARRDVELHKKALDALAGRLEVLLECIDADDWTKLHNSIISCTTQLELLDSFQQVAYSDDKILEACLRVLRVSLIPKSDAMLSSFALGPLLRIMAQIEDANRLPEDLLRQLLVASKGYGQRIQYLEAMVKVFHLVPSLLQQSTVELETFSDRIVENLPSSSHHVRQLSLELLRLAHVAPHGYEPQLLSVALEIENLPPTLKNVRSISMGIRRIAAGYVDAAQTPLLRRALPLYCFGLLHIRLTPIWEDACKALAAMIETDGAADTVVNQAMDWLRGTGKDSSSDLDTSPNYHAAAETNRSLGCTELDSLSSRIEHILSPNSIRRPHIEPESHFLPQSSNSNRSQALRILGQMPGVAEKRSRCFVPFLLDITAAKSDDVDGEYADLGETKPEPIIKGAETSTSTWSRKEQKALLDVFAKFNNPTVLYLSKHVYESLLTLLMSGDAEIQNSALKAIFTWKSPSIRQYEEHLLGLVDDSRLQEELAVLLSNHEDQKTIQDEHRTILLPVLLRLMFGRLIARAGSANRQGTVESRRKAILAKLTQLPADDLDQFIQISLGRLYGLNVLIADQPNEDLLEKSIITPRKQLGVLKVVEDMLEFVHLPSKVIFTSLLNVVLYATVRATRLSANQDGSHGDDAIQQHLVRSVRQQGLVSLNSLFIKGHDFEWSQYAPFIYGELVEGKLRNLPIETAQAPSILLKLFASWASSVPMLPLLLQPGNNLLNTVASCLAVKSARVEVRLFVMRDIFSPLAALIDTSIMVEPEGKEEINDLRHIFKTGLGSHLLRCFNDSLEFSTNYDYVETAVRVIVQLLPWLENSSALSSAIHTLTDLLEQPVSVIELRLKTQIAHLMERLLRCPAASDTDISPVRIYDVTCPLFRTFRSFESRETLTNILSLLSQFDENIKQPATLCEELNAFSVGKLGQPDFDRRLEAYRILNESLYSTLGSQEWKAVLYNLLYFLRDHEELSIRASASFGVRRFIQAASLQMTPGSNLPTLLKRIVMPALSKGMREPSELVRAEYLQALAEVVKHDWPETQDLKVLLGNDEESSIFNNILHLQQHRRQRALRRLSTNASTFSSRSSRLFLLPLVESILDTSDSSAQQIAQEAINCLGALAETLEWSGFIALLGRNMNEVAKLESKRSTRIVSACVDCLIRACRARMMWKESSSEPTVGRSGTESKLASTIPGSDEFTATILRIVVAPSMEQVHFKDEGEIEHRLSLSTIVVKVLLLLSSEQANLRLESLLGDVCNILKSRSQETRDAARKSMAEICALLGPQYFGFVLSALRNSLRRGYQIHVLSYSLHSILVSMSPSLRSGDLDFCLSDLMPLIMEDIFGAAGQEKEAYEYTSKMKEVKQKSRGFDSVELVASVTTPAHVSELIKPIRSQLEGRKPRLEKVDQLLARIREGLRNNEAINNRQSLVLCYEILRDAYCEDSDRNFQSTYSFKLASFALDTLRRILDKHEELKTAENVAGFVTLLEKSMSQKQDEVQTAAFRFMTSIIKVRLQSMDDNAGNLIRQVKRTIQASPSTNEPVAQAALRLAAGILRERPYAVVKQKHFETDISYLLNRIKPDLEEPSRQGERDRQLAAFNFLKAVTSRGVLMKELYEVMDIVRQVMINSREPPVPSLARSCYSRFLVDYFPEDGKGFLKQFEFLLSNLQYPHPPGRLSVMEVFLFILNKKDNEFVQPLLTNLFLPLLLTAVSDESIECQQSAQLLLRTVMEKADKERLRALQRQMHSWLDTENDPIWRRASILCWKTYFEKHADSQKEASAVFSQLRGIIMNGGSRTPEDMQLLSSALDLLSLLCNMVPTTTFAAGAKDMWTAIFVLTSSNFGSIRLSCAVLTEMCFAHLSLNHSQAGAADALPLKNSSGFKIDEEDVKSIVRASLRSIKKDGDATNCGQLIKNISFLVKILAQGKAIGIVEELFEQAASIARFEDTDTSLQSKQAALRLLHSLCNLVPADMLRSLLQVVLLPLRNLTDSSIPTTSFSDPALSALQNENVQVAQELLELLQAKVGTTHFLEEMRQIQKEVLERRDDRRAKRRIEAVSMPEKAQRVKQKKREGNKEKRRERNSQAAGKRRGW